MSRHIFYIPRSKPEKVIYFATVAAEAAVIKGDFPTILTAAVVKKLADIANNAKNLRDNVEEAKEYQSALVNFENRFLAGDRVMGETLGKMPTLPPPRAVIDTGEDAEQFVSNILQSIKRHEKYTESVGKRLGLIGPEQTTPPPSEVQAIFTAKINGRDLEISAKLQGYDDMQLFVDKGDGKGEVLFETINKAREIIPIDDYPAAPQKWTLTAWLRDGRRKIGKKSNAVEIVVGG